MNKVTLLVLPNPYEWSDVDSMLDKTPTLISKKRGVPVYENDFLIHNASIEVENLNQAINYLKAQYQVLFIRDDSEQVHKPLLKTVFSVKEVAQLTNLGEASIKNRLIKKEIFAFKLDDHIWAIPAGEVPKFQKKSRGVLWGIKMRENALDVINNEKDKAETEQKKEAWAICKDLVEYPFFVDFDWAKKWSDQTEPNVFLQIEKVLSAEIAWLIYSSYLTDWDKNAQGYPKFLLPNQMVFDLACRAEEDDEKRARYMGMNERLLKRVPENNQVIQLRADFRK